MEVKTTEVRKGQLFVCPETKERSTIYKVEHHTGFIVIHTDKQGQLIYGFNQTVPVTQTIN